MTVYYLNVAVASLGYDPQARAFRVTAMAANWEPVGETVYE